MKISLCMITRNEERFIGSCLESVKNYVDEIIIVDTGSSDQTCHIALTYGAKIYHQEWQDDFSKARNFGIDRAKGEWILYLDADETLEHGELLKPLLNQANQETDGFLFQIVNYLDNAKLTVEKGVNVRLFRNRKENRFFGAIHEQLPFHDKEVIWTDLVIHHYGYLPSVTLDREKSKRNMRILLREVENDPKHPFVRYNLGMEYLRLGQYEKATDHYLRAVEHLTGENGYEHRLYKMLSKCFLQLEPKEEFLSIMAKGIRKFPDYPDLYYARGLYFESIGKWTQSAADYLKCLHLGREEADPNMYVLENGITSYKSYEGLGRIFERMGKTKEARIAYARCLKAMPSNLKVLSKLLALHDGVSKTTFIDLLVQEAIPKEKEDDYRLNYASLLFDLDQDESVVLMLKGINDCKYIGRAYLLLGMCFYKKKRFDQAIHHFSKLAKANEMTNQASPLLAASLWMNGQHKKANQVLSRSNSPGEGYCNASGLILEELSERTQEYLQKFPHCVPLIKEHEKWQRVQKEWNNQNQQLASV